MIIYGLKVNVSTTIIGMVRAANITDANGTVSSCPEFENAASTSGSSGPEVQGSYNWSSFEQGLVVSVYFAGYMLGMFPAGYFADRFVGSSSILCNECESGKITCA